MSVLGGDRKFVKIGKYIKGHYSVSWGVSGLATFSNPCLLLPTFVDIPAGNRIVGTFILKTSDSVNLYNGFLVVNASNKDRAEIRIVRYDTSVPPPPFTNLQFITNTTPSASIQTDGVLEFSFEYISAT